MSVALAAHNVRVRCCVENAGPRETQDPTTLEEKCSMKSIIFNVMFRALAEKNQEGYSFVLSHEVIEVLKLATRIFKTTAVQYVTCACSQKVG